MQTTTAADIILAARQQADAETPSPSTDFVTDTEALRYLTTSYRRLMDAIITEGGQDRLLVSVALTAPAYTLPTDFYREVSVDVTVAGRTRPLPRFNFRERHRYLNTSFPSWRIINGAIVFEPVDSQPVVTLWYVPDMDPLASTSTSLNTFNGWEEYCVADVAAYIMEKEERDANVQYQRRADAFARIVRVCHEMALSSSEKIAQVEFMPEDLYDRLW